MASNQTSNYGLSQWEATDQVQRAEFNEDNAKVDAALTQKLGAIELIAETTLTGWDFDVTLDLSQVDWDQWSIVVLLAEPKGGSSASSYSFQMQGISEHQVSKLDADITPLVGPRMIVLFPLRDQTRQVHYLRFPGGQLVLSENAYNNIQAASAGTNTSYGLYTGSSIKMFGIR